MEGLLFFSPPSFVELAIVRTAAAPKAFTGFVVACEIAHGSSSECGALAGANVADLSGNALDPNSVSDFGRRLPGAVVFANQASGASPSQFQPAALLPGQLVGVADSEGRYALALPFTVGTAYAMHAFHPDFPNQQAISTQQPVDDGRSSDRID